MPRAKIGPIPLEPFALAATHEGAWYGADPTGYKFVRLELARAQWAPDLDASISSQPPRLGIGIAMSSMPYYDLVQKTA
jgi:hypothetical protein